MADIVQLPGTSPDTSLKEAVRKMEIEFPDMVKYIELTAELRKVKYEALRKTGFNEEQSLFLCTKLFD